MPTIPNSRIKLWPEGFPVMAKLLEPRKIGQVEIRGRQVPHSSLIGLYRTEMQLLFLIPPSENNLHTVGDDGMVPLLMMSDHPAERDEESLELLKEAEGDVLIGGLGLGMVPTALAMKKEVKKIIVVELCKEVIDMVEPQLRKLSCWKKVTVIHEDIHKFVPQQKYDAIFIDIWPDISRRNLPEYHKLFNKYWPKHLKARHSLILCWAYERALNQRSTPIPPMEEVERKMTAFLLPR